MWDLCDGPAAQFGYEVRNEPPSNQGTPLSPSAVGTAQRVHKWKQRLLIWSFSRLASASDMPFASECLVNAAAAIASETFIRTSHP